MAFAASRAGRAVKGGSICSACSRQAEILRLLAENLSNKEISARLGISPKTVDHHVVAVLAKLDVPTRTEAAAHAVTAALLAKHRESAAPR